MNPSFPTALFSEPSSGMKALPLSLDFTDAATLTKHISDDILQINNMDFIQSIFVDNSANNDPIIFIFRTILAGGYNLKFPAGTQGWMPVLVPKGIIEFSVSTALGNIVNIQLGNFPVAPIIWPSANIGTVTADITPIVANAVNRSMTLTGGDDTVMAINAARKRMFLQNHPNNINPMFLEFGGGASITTSQVLVPGDVFDSELGPVSGQAVHVKGTANDLLVAWEQ